MPRHDYRHCGEVLRDVYRSVQEGAQGRPPACPACGEPMDWIPGVGRMDASGGSTFQAFEALDGRNRPVLIDSLSKMRKVERESEQLARNGEGQHLTWRHWSQDHSNIGDNTHGPDPSERPTPEAARRFSPIRHGELQPAPEYGPAVNDSNASAL